MNDLSKKRGSFIICYIASEVFIEVFYSLVKISTIYSWSDLFFNHLTSKKIRDISL